MSISKLSIFKATAFGLMVGAGFGLAVTSLNQSLPTIETAGTITAAATVQ